MSTTHASISNEVIPEVQMALNDIIDSAQVVVVSAFKAEQPPPPAPEKPSETPTSTSTSNNNNFQPKTSPLTTQSNGSPTLDKFKNFISLKGKIVFKEGIKYKNLVEFIKDDPSSGDINEIEAKGKVVATWQGTWAMTDAAFSSSHGVTSDFCYQIRRNEDSLLDDDDVNSLLLKGFFNIKNTNSYTKITESETILSLMLETTEASKMGVPVNADDGELQVIGTGSNQYGEFKLYGKYNTNLNEMSCYRQYLPKQSKRKTKRPRPSNISTFGALPPTSPLLVGSLAENKPKRAKKPPVHLKGVPLNGKPTPMVPVFSPVVKIENDLDSFKLLVDKLYQSDKERWFTQPVDPDALGLSTYRTIITHPMDLGTIIQKYADKRYSDYEEMVDDVRLTFRNAMTFNPPKDAVHTVAKLHLKLFERDFKQWKLDKERKEKKKAQQEKKERDRQRKLKAKKNPLGAFMDTNFSDATMKQREEIIKHQKKIKSLSKSMFDSSDDDDSADSSSSDDDDLFVKHKNKSSPAKAKPARKPAKKKKKKSKKTDQMMLLQTLSQQMESMSRLMAAGANPVMQQTLSNSMIQLQMLAQQNGMQPNTPPMGAAPGNQVAYQQIPVGNQAAKAPKPKKPRPVKELEYQEKVQLSDDIQRLPVANLENLVRFLSKHGVAFDSDDEVELDIDVIPPRVLRKLQKWVADELTKIKSTANVTEMTFE